MNNLDAFLVEQRNKAIIWAQKLIDTQFLVFDTETTGTGPNDEIIQLGVMYSDGKNWINTLIKPRYKTEWLGAQKVHGISPEDVADAPTIKEYWQHIYSIFRSEYVIAYNMAFDQRMLKQSFETAKLLTEWNNLYRSSTWECAMLKYAAFNGNWSSYHKSFRWVKLAEAAMLEGIEVKDAHDALGDVKMTIALISAMSKYELE